MNKNIMLVLGGLSTIVGVVLLVMHFTGGSDAGNLQLQIEHKPAIMSAAYKVHANKDLKSGRYWVAKVLLTNEGPGDLDDVSVAYRIPNFIDWTTPRPYPKILPNQTVVDLFYPRFQSNLSQKLTTTTEQVEIKISYKSGGESKEELRKVDFDLRGRNDLIYTTMDADEISSITDVYENTDLIASFVTPDDPVIKHFTQQLQQKVLGGTVAGVSNTQEEVLRFMRGLYNYQLASGLVYGGTKGLPQQIGNSFTVVQHVRMPREVLTGEAGLCVELSTLFSSVALSAGLEPVIFLTQKHAWPGIKMGDGSIIPIEATSIGGEGIGGRQDFDKAVEAGVKNMQTFMAGGDQGIGASIGLLDISQLHAAGIRPPELSDDNDLRGRVDTTMAKLIEGAKKSSQPEPKKRVVRRNDGGGGSGGGGSGRGPSVPSGFQQYAHPSGVFAVGFPSGWAALTNPYPQQMPNLAAVLSPNPNMPGPGAEVYVFEGANDSSIAISEIAYAVENIGGYLTAQPTGTVALQGQSYQVFNGETAYATHAIHWRAYFRPMGSRTVGIVVYAPAGTMGGYNQMLSQIADTFVTR